MFNYCLKKLKKVEGLDNSFIFVTYNFKFTANLTLMKKFLPAICFALLLFQAGLSQNTEQPGKPIAELFTDFHLIINDTSSHTGFGLSRAYIGYQFMPAGKFTGKVILNVGTPEDLAPGSTPKRYSFFREASITWAGEKLSITGGIASTRMFMYQQAFWGKRYVANTYQSLNGFGIVADLGMIVEYKFSDIVTADYSLMNGEGYTEIHLDNSLKNSLGVTFTPNKNLAIRIYGDIFRREGIWQPLIIAFVGFKNDLLTLGGEISYKSNADLIQGHHLWGISSTGGVNLSEKTQFFVRYDYAASFKMKGETNPWNNLKDGSLLISGVQFTLSPNVKIAFDYQGKYPYEVSSPKTGLIYVNGLFKF
jgi:hypothetical protein